VDRLDEIGKEMQGKIEMVFVYIKEAHPADEWQMESNEEDGVVFDQPRSDEERMVRAQAFVSEMDIEAPTLVDDIRNTANACYAAWPERLYVVDTTGRIAYKGGMGPFKFDTDELEEFLATL
jgi:hypothetical protein